MKKFILYILLLVSLSSCISLTKSQRAGVNRFADNTDRFGDSPSVIMTELSAFRELRSLYYVNSLDNPGLHLDELEKVYDEKVVSLRNAASIERSFQILNQYAKSLKLLSAESFSVRPVKIAFKMGNELEKLTAYYNMIEGVNQLPVGIGSAITEVLGSVGSLTMKSRQAKAIKLFIIEADTLVSITCESITQYLKSDELTELISNEKSGLRESYHFYLTKRSVPPIEQDLNYLQLLKKISTIENLRKNTLRSISSLRKGHLQLIAEIRKRKDWDENIKVYVDFTHQIDQLTHTIENLNIK